MKRAGAALMAFALANCTSSTSVEGSEANTPSTVTNPPPVRALPVLTNPDPFSVRRRFEGSPISYEGASKKCAACHSLSPGRHGIGPSLGGAYGRPAASAPNYRYSNALKESGLVWDAATLDKFLENPRAMVPGTKMTFTGLKDPLQRAQVIAYIERYRE